MGLKYQSLIEHFQAKPEEAAAHIELAFKKKDIKPSDVNLGELFVECFGWRAFVDCRAKKSLARNIMEAAGAVGTAAFQNISGQLVITATMDGYDYP